MINLSNKKQKPETKLALSWDELRFIAENHSDQSLKDKAGEMLVKRDETTHENLNNITSDKRYSLKIRILAGEEYLKYFTPAMMHSINPHLTQEQLINISACKDYLEETREKAGIKHIDICVSEGNYSKLAEINEGNCHLLSVRDYVKKNINLAVQNRIKYYVKTGSLDYLLSLEKDQNIPVEMKEKIKENVFETVKNKIKPSLDKKIPNYCFELVERNDLPESIKDWLKKQGTEIARENVNDFYSKGNYSDLMHYTYWSWVPQEIKELSKKKLEELAVNMGKRL